VLYFGEWSILAVFLDFNMSYDFIKLSDLIPGAASKFKMAGAFKSAMLMHVFKTIARDVLPGSIADRVRPKYIKQGVLWVAVPHSIASQEVNQKAHIISRLLNERFGQEEVKGVRVVVES
jgi:hypothetical protein